MMRMGPACCRVVRFAAKWIGEAANGRKGRRRAMHETIYSMPVDYEEIRPHINAAFIRTTRAEGASSQSFPHLVGQWNGTTPAAPPNQTLTRPDLTD